MLNARSLFRLRYCFSRSLVAFAKPYSCLSWIKGLTSSFVSPLVRFINRVSFPCGSLILSSTAWSEISIVKRIPIKYFCIYLRCRLLFDKLVQHFTNLTVLLTRFCDPVVNSFWFAVILLYWSCRWCCLFCNSTCWLLVVESLLTLNILEFCSCTRLLILIQIILLLCHYWKSARVKQYTLWICLECLIIYHNKKFRRKTIHMLK